MRSNARMGERCVTMSKHFDTVQSIYAAFGRGDVPTILATLSGDIDWDYEAGSTDMPWIQNRRGAANVGGFFEAVGKELDMKQFSVNAIVGNGDLVVALVTIEAVVRRTGRSFRE